ncbi:nischarin [Esox lucius]|uniref:nischarin n=1 Tax=Esox lucius TaxID=8010 RepID=UPI00147759BB|nr:nischarin [Esox lucius]
MLNYSNLRTSLLPLHLLSCASTCSAFTSLLSKRISKALGEKKEQNEKKPSILGDLPSQQGTYLGSPGISSGDGYFEMGLGQEEGEEEEEETEGEGCPASLSDQGEFEVQGEHGAPEEEVVVTRVVWCLCLKVGDVVEQRSVCLVLTEGLLALFHAPDPSSAAQLHNPSPLSAPCGQPHGLPHLVDVLEADFVIPRDQIASVILDIPDACLSLRVRSSNVVWFLFSDSESLMAAHSSLCSLAQLPSSTCLSGEPSTSQQLLKLLLTSWEFEENQDCVKGGYVAHLVETALFAPPTSTLSTATNQTSTLSTATNQTSTLSTATNQTSTLSTTPNQTSTLSTTPNQTSTLSTATNQTSTLSTATNQTSTLSTTPNQTSTLSTATNQTSTLSTATNQTSTLSTATNQTSTLSTATNQTSTLSTATNQTSALSTATNQLSSPLRTSSNPIASTVLGPTASPLNPTNPRVSDVLSHIVPGGEADRGSCCLPCVLFLTQLHVYVLKVDFPALARDQTENSSLRLRSFARLSRLPLASVLLHPRLSDLSGSDTASPPCCPRPGHRPPPRDAHVLELLLGQERVTVLFPLPHDRLRFQRQFSSLRSSLRDIKTVAFLQGGKEYKHSDSDSPQAINIYPSSLSRSKRTDRLQVNSPGGTRRPRPSLSLSYPTKCLLEKLTEDNQVPPHLTLSLSPAQSLLSGLRGQDLLGFFHTNIAEVEKEELQHILWSSVVFYKSPDIEVTSCIMLSTKALYFLLDNSASTLIDQSLLGVSWRSAEWQESSALWNGNRCDSQYQPDPELLMSYCFTMKLNHLHSINVGLFDQYFRVVGPSAENILCCLTRDSYGTHRFLQQLMTVLSLQEKLPSPEPSDQDFYTQFGNKSSGKMKNYEMVHSSRVKFIYPSEEEIGDLTFIVAERKGPSGSSSCNILLYVLVFQVQTQSADCSGTKTQGPVSASQPRLHPQSLPAAPPVPSKPTPKGLPPLAPPPSRPTLKGLPPLAPPASRPLLHPKTLVLTSTDVFLLDEDYISYPLPDFAKEPPPRDKYQLTDARRIRDLDRVLMGYQTYPQALTLVFDDVPGPDLLCHLTMDHFGDQEVAGRGGRAGVSGGAESEVQWCVYVPGADSRERLICLLARQWEGLCSRELPVELTG